MISLIKLCLRTNTRAFKYIFQFCIYVYGVEYDTYVKYHKKQDSSTSDVHFRAHHKSL